MIVARLATAAIADSQAVGTGGGRGGNEGITMGGKEGSAKMKRQSQSCGV